MLDDDMDQIIANIENANKAIEIANQQLEAAIKMLEKPKKPRLEIVEGDKRD